eukprot:2486881-Rhodomonas_salina.2
MHWAQGNFPDGVIQDLSDEVARSLLPRALTVRCPILTHLDYAASRLEWRSLFSMVFYSRTSQSTDAVSRTVRVTTFACSMQDSHVVVISDLSCDRDHSVVVTAELEVYRNEQGSPSGSPLEIKAFACESEFRLVDTASLLRPHPRPDLPLDDFPPDVHFETHAEITSDKRLLEGAITRSDFFGFRKDFE